MTIAAGQLRNHITFQEDVSTAVDDLGAHVPAWTVLPKTPGVHAKITATGGGETLRGIMIEAGIESVVEIRHRTDITSKMRITFGSRTLNIERAIDPTGMQEDLVLLCKEVA